jgi:hypothetical protein
MKETINRGVKIVGLPPALHARFSDHYSLLNNGLEVREA